MGAEDPSAAPPLYQPPVQLPPGDGPLRLLWAARLRPRFFRGGTHLAWRDLAILHAQEEVGLRDYITALDPRTGETVWCVRCGQGRIYCVLVGDVLAVTGDMPWILGLDPAGAFCAGASRSRGVSCCPCRMRTTRRTC